ncbi:hypothetical protein B8W90_12245, partial [Staphylococcus hominis]
MKAGWAPLLVYLSATAISLLPVGRRSSVASTLACAGQIVSANNSEAATMWGLLIGWLVPR